MQAEIRICMISRLAAAIITTVHPEYDLARSEGPAIFFF